MTARYPLTENPWLRAELDARAPESSFAQGLIAMVVVGALVVLGGWTVWSVVRGLLQ